jgi:hypothetical protein
MTWLPNDVTNLILLGKDVGIHFSDSICRNLDLGRSIDHDLEYLYLMCNIIFALENSDMYEDEDYDLLSEMVNRIQTQILKYRGL